MSTLFVKKLALNIEKHLIGRGVSRQCLPYSSKNGILANMSVKKKYFTFHYIRECIRMAAAGVRTRRSLGYHLLHPLILRLQYIVCALADFQTQCSLLQNRLHPQIQIPNACPEYTHKIRQNLLHVVQSRLEIVSSHGTQYIYSTQASKNSFYL